MNWLGSGLVGLALVGAGLLIEAAGCFASFSATGSDGAGGAASAGAAGGGGSGAGMATGCPPCPSGQYCDPQLSRCVACSDLGRLQLGTPAAVGVTVPASGAGELYPRVDRDTGDLYLVEQSAAHLDQLARAPFMMGKAPWTTAALLSKLVGTHQDSGPLYLPNPLLLLGLVPDAIAKLGMPVLLFDSDRNGSRRIFAVDLAGTAPAQLVLPGNATRESRVALAMDAPTPRFFWISDAGAMGDRLVTATATDTMPAPVPIVLDSGCPVPLVDTPWVTPEGDLLLFTSPHYGPSPACASPDLTLTHLYQVPLDPTGQATTEAARVFPDDASTDTTPALTPDQCTLLFARVDDTANAKLYAAARD